MKIANNAHYEWLDLLRFAAAIAVVLAHTRGFLFQEYSALDPSSRNIATMVFYAFTRMGHEAVIVFFVLSGYLVGGKAIERIAQGTFQPRDYAIDRITRLWVPLLPALVLSAVAGGNKDGIGVWVANLLGLQGVLAPSLGENGPLWSLAYEVWFYVLAYAIGRQSLRGSMDLPALVLIAVVAMVVTKLQVQYLACWLIGAAFFVKPHRLSVRRGLLVSTVVSLAAIAGLQLTSKGSLSVAVSLGGLHTSFEILLAVGTGLACVTLTAIRPRRFSGLAVPLSAFSYTLYLTHYPLLLVLKNNGWVRITSLGPAAYGLYAVVIGACLGIAWMMYWVFERNTAMVRKWIKTRSNHSAIAPKVFQTPGASPAVHDHPTDSRAVGAEL